MLDMRFPFKYNFCRSGVSRSPSIASISLFYSNNKNLEINYLNMSHLQVKMGQFPERQYFDPRDVVSLKIQHSKIFADPILCP